MTTDNVTKFRAMFPRRPEVRDARATERRERDAAMREAAEMMDGILAGFGDYLRSVRIDPNKERPTPSELVYRVSPANGGIVFATPERARYVADLHSALASKTWGEFRSRIPAEEWEHLAKWFDEEPAPEKPFDSEGVPGFCDGDWPPWLQKEILQVLPPPLVRDFAKACMTSINGVYFHVDRKNLKPLLRGLEERGIRATHAPRLEFW